MASAVLIRAPSAVLIRAPSAVSPIRITKAAAVCMVATISAELGGRKCEGERDGVEKIAVHRSNVTYCSEISGFDYGVGTPYDITEG